MALAVARSILIDRATADYLDALSARGASAIVLKGPAMSRWLYDGEADRTYVDMDLLVKPGDMGVAEEVAHELGYVRHGLETIEGDWQRHALVMTRGDGATLDLHRTLLGVNVSDGELWSAISARTEDIDLGGKTVTMPGEEARAVVLALHAAKDGGRVAKVRRDLYRAAERVSIETWIAAARLADELGASRAFAAGLRRDPSSARIADALGLGAAIPFEVAIRPDGAPPLAVGMASSLRDHGYLGTARITLRKLFPPPAYVRAWSPRARSGGWGLAVAYVHRPFWVLRRSIPAAVAVRRARKQSEVR
jgi:hypothetical protein